ncbi:ABC-three component system protein [Catenibacterium mitsuokai]|uniref:ABC-three component system protein n=1 Tax=Catenibacterium mitsuokai TaxID=100886 RepID=UPI003F911A34
MYFHEVAEELKYFLAPSVRDGDFVIQLVSDILRDPLTEEEEQLNKDDEYNPLASLSFSMLDKIFAGEKFISKANARKICSRFDGLNFAETIDNLYDSDREHLLQFLEKNNIQLADINDLGSAMQDILNQIFRGLSKGNHDVDIRLTIYDAKPTIRSLTENRIYFENGKLVIDGEEIELPVHLDDSQIYDFEDGYIFALCNAYAEVLNKDAIKIDDIASLPPKYQMNFLNQRKAYLSAESIQRSISEVYDEGENQFNILKEDALAGIETTYYDDYDNGYKRLLEVLKKISNVQLTKSKLMLIKNLIGNLERLGIVHILVNDQKIKSWVDPYEE